MAEQNEKNPSKPIGWVKSPNGVQEFYANMSHITWTLDDLRIRLGQLVDSPETPNPGGGFKAVAEERTAITFSWRAAVMLRDQLIALVKAYEDLNGPIKTDLKLPPPPF
jgi:hypothetical protein